ncbi:MAG TPA: hypothetical protein PLP07_12425 [Pyrinomonadaceae bacterium]|nr:hypothetical protein [Pyrinomonadaceae bacterium]
MDRTNLDAHPLFTAFVAAAWDNRVKSENLEHDVSREVTTEASERVEVGADE